MTSIQDQYTEFAKRGQDATFAVIDAWTQSVQDTVGQLPVVTSKAAAQHVVDQFFDYAGTVLDIQRKVAQQLVTSGAATAEDITERATKAASEARATVTEVTTGRARKSAS